MWFFYEYWQKDSRPQISSWKPFSCLEKRSFVFDRAKEGHKMNCLLWAMFQNGRFVGDADLERQKFSDLKLNGPQVSLLAPGLGCIMHIFILPQPTGAYWCLVKCKYPLIRFFLFRKIWVELQRIYVVFILEWILMTIDPVFDPSITVSPFQNGGVCAW